MPEHSNGWDRGRQDPAGEPRRPGDPPEDWLTARVPPLPPPAGTLQRIRRRARRRKLSRAAAGAAGAALAVVALATLPRLALSELQPAAQPRGVTAGHTLTRPTVGRLTSPPPQAASSTPVPTAPPHPPVPPNFAPTSVTFVGTQTGFVIGQAGVPGHCANPVPSICTSLARTDNGGQSWYGVPAPDAGAPDGQKGVSQLRFLNTEDGWAFGPELWATHDGGHTWTRIPTHGLRVTALETVNGTAYAVWAQCRGSGAAYAADCTSFTLYSSPAGAGSWQPVAGTAGGLSAGGTPSSAPLVLTGTAGYLLAPSGDLLTARVAGGSGSWQAVASGLLNSAPCAPVAPGQAGGALLAAPGHDLALLCQQAGQVDMSADGGRTWQLTGQVAVAGTPTSMAGAPSGTLVLATTKGIDISGNGGGSWHAAQVGQAPAGGFSYVGMTTTSQGVAVPANPRRGAVWFSYDGGRVWQPSYVRSPS